MLGSLPNEVVGIIVGFCQPGDLCALSRTCKPLHGHAVPALYRSISLSNKTNAESVLAELTNEDGEERMSDHRPPAELLKLTRSLNVTLPWHHPNSWRTKRAIHNVNQMTGLRHLSIMYVEEEEYMEGHDLPLPSMLARTLTSCTVGFKDWANWTISEAACLLKHQTLRQLKLHWATSQVHVRIPDMGKGSTVLKSLSLIDCNIDPEDLYRVLRYPRALQYLTLATDFGDNNIIDDEEINCSNYFAAIQRASGKSLKGLRFDVTHMGNLIVPAPGMHELRNVLYLEVAPDHIELAKDVLSFTIPIPDIECPLEHLLPPNLEVLKLTPSASDMPTLWNIVERRGDIVPHLRKIILSLDYRNRIMKKELITALQKREDYDPEVLKDEEDLQDMYPCVRKRVLRSFRRYCEEHGVELMFLYEDIMRKEILEEGAGPSVWEIEDQNR
ncbi:hypothetical protein N431DRAFT_479629 [Stipitochalara longipes BDJ]|nr:hypothetical protein N431DRAFT_479629 [Stipitochalara longipes BDJ]